MLFFGKRPNLHQSSASPVQTCFNFGGLVIVIALCGGLAGLIYGIIKQSSTALIGGGIVLGVSLALTVLLILIFVFCIKKKQPTDEHLSSSSGVHHSRSQHPHSNIYPQLQQHFNSQPL
ncbi:unnamed protein product [Didymodactylos carnosus]|uniref:Uncharacterized protein n=1 Tax=Didymodactylos carnosus TaxID=1234261 RepID=A0A815DW59_9BILA|nr:unnamed protein product [Didymodactylos carnosus]CAF1306647.1 unnamed protein product [Didymodactylos carnosus]CAF3650249.1 unnamed protein product [Didymodactylos carnosus]CAF4140501.1 unnamed protein product [Didymodactylos carnosus]